MALAGAEAELTLPRGGEQQAALVETPATEHSPHLQALDGSSPRRQEARLSG